jgi:hypothetical protein
MPTIAQAQQAAAQLLANQPATLANPAVPTNPIPAALPEPSLVPRRSPALRAPAIFIPGTFPSSDSLTGYHIGSIVPQYRAPLPPQASAGGSGTRRARPRTTQPKAQTVAITTSVIPASGRFTGTLAMAKGFMVLSFSTDGPARIRLYSTAAAQSADANRPATVAPGLGTNTYLIGDVYLDTAPYFWPASNMVGYNGDAPQTGNVYCTLDNLSTSVSMPYTLSIQFVPLQS